ncbi:MAG: hypothetical protein EHM93_09400 [Bacteroidales bacterium]|nr:MAG: hypothetical protein EHM93_09400 [Bacteroidales bacterium]
MRNNANTLRCSKLLVTILCLLFISSAISAQNRTPQDIRRVTVTFQYAVEKGKRTDMVYPIYQEIFDSLGRCHTEIEWSLTDHYPHNYYWNSFKGKQKVISEFYLNEKLNTIEEFTYNKDSLLAMRVVKKVSPTDTTISLTFIYKYDSNRNPIEISAKSRDGKTAYVSKSTFNIKGKELTRKVKIKKNFSPQDSIVNLVSVPVYDSIGRLAREQLTIKKFDKTTVIRTINYSYDRNNNQIGVLVLNEKGKQVSREVREYQYSRNRLSLINHYDSNDVLVKFNTKRYEIYRTKDRKVREIEY